MNFLLIAGIILLLCALSSKVLYRYGIPTLIAFLAMGMLLGSEGIGGFQFDNIEITQFVCNIGLVYIMFSGGFGTNWETAKPVALSAGVMATLGVAVTAFVIGLFAHFALKLPFLESMLLGSIISSTDAASVFSILRSKDLNLKKGLAPLLEMESGSNDPMAYMLTTIFIGLIVGEGSNIFVMLITQISIGALVGVAVALAAVWLMNNINLDIDSLYTIMLMGVAILAFSGASLLGGNGFLAVYITGIIMGNKKLVHKVSLVRYFDGVSWLMQILLFITLGLLVSPSGLMGVMLPGIATAIFIIFIARPIAVYAILPFFKQSFNNKFFVSWVGFRGAASIVFATYPLNAGIASAEYIFNIVFFVALVSVMVQGTLLVPIAQKLDLLSEDETVLRTFTDYSGDIHTELLEIVIPEESCMVNKRIMNVDIPQDILIVMIKREGKIITPKGNTILREGDIIMLAGKNKEQLFAVDMRFNETQRLT